MNLMNMNAAKTAVITGATGGIGRALCVELLMCDGSLKLFVVGRDEETLKQIQAQFPERVEIIVCDLANDKQSDELLDALQSLEQIDFLIHCAAIIHPLKQLAEVGISEWRMAQKVNVEIPLFLTTSLMPKLKHGRVMFLTSDSELQAVVGAGSYCMSKSTIHMLWQCLKAEYQGVEKNKENKYSSTNIAFGLIAPGNVDTKMQTAIRETDESVLPFAPLLAQAYKQGQLLKPDYVAQFLRWLLYDIDANQYSQKVWNIYAELSHQSWLKNDE
jgi:NAD(P)-dependent dehydrogenase (short-subunit alcohol dehydrogenase family)